MRCLRFVAAISVALAACTSDASGVAARKTSPPPKQSPTAHVGEGRTGGDRIYDATVISAFPFFDTGSTSGFTNDYDEVCPYPGSTSPDVVYRYTSWANEVIDLEFCSSAYDTKVYIYQGAVGNLIACNDDAGCGYSGYQSKLCAVPLTGGNTYYIVIDGYDGASGEYAMMIAPGICAPPIICPGDGVLEGEPPCGDGYFDQYNSGCEGGMEWTPVPADADECTTMCGRSCTFLNQGLSYRDSDWYSAVAAGSTVSIWLQSEFEAVAVLVYNTDCANLGYVYGTGGGYGGVQLSWSGFAAGEPVWVVVYPNGFSGVIDADYTLEVCGIGSLATGACCVAGECTVTTTSDCTQVGGSYLGDGTVCEPNPCPPTPVERTSWGAIKRRFH